MNHPDIHWLQLCQLIGEIDLDGVWCGTFQEIAEWFATAKYAVSEYAEAVET